MHTSHARSVKQRPAQINISVIGVVLLDTPLPLSPYSAGEASPQLPEVLCRQAAWLFFIPGRRADACSARRRSPPARARTRGKSTGSGLAPGDGLLYE